MYTSYNIGISYKKSLGNILLTNYFFSLSKYFIENSIQQFQKRDKSESEEKGILEKLLEIDEEVAIIMASDMLLAGVDTVCFLSHEDLK